MWLLSGLVLLLLSSTCRKATAEDSPVDFHLLELSLGNFKAVLLNRTISTEAVLRNIAGNVTVIIFQIHSHQKNVTVSFDKECIDCNQRYHPGVHNSRVAVVTNAIKKTTFIFI